MKLDDLQKLVAQGESETLEFKKSTGQRTEAAKTVCAMLNGQGGHVLFGVTNDGEIVGQHVTAKTLEDLANEFRKIEPQVGPKIEAINLGNDKAVIVVTVTGDVGPFTYDARPFVRSGPTTQRMDRFQYERRLTERMHTTTRWELLPVPEDVTIADLDAEEIQITLENAIRIGRMDRPKRENTKSILMGLNLFENGELINAALALYGKSVRLQNRFPQFAIRMARFRGAGKAADFADNRQYWGHVFELLRRAESFLMDHVPIAGKVMPGQMRRIDQPWYPPRATREALANAICHRDYSMHGGAVALAMYDDRIEIENPDGLHFGITPATLVRPHSSNPWNPRIAEVFYRAGIIEKWGAGITNILDWCKENGNPKPQWETREPGSVVVTFRPVKLDGRSQPDSQLESPLESQLESPLESKTESLEEKVLAVLSGGEFSKSEMAKAFGQKGISGQLHQVVKALLSEGRIEYTIPDKPNSRLQKYRLVRKD